MSIIRLGGWASTLMSIMRLGGCASAVHLYLNVEPAELVLRLVQELGHQLGVLALACVTRNSKSAHQLIQNT